MCTFAFYCACNYKTVVKGVFYQILPFCILIKLLFLTAATECEGNKYSQVKVHHIFYMYNWFF